MENKHNSQCHTHLFMRRVSFILTRLLELFNHYLKSEYTNSNHGRHERVGCLGSVELFYEVNGVKDSSTGTRVCWLLV